MYIHFSSVSNHFYFTHLNNYDFLIKKSTTKHNRFGLIIFKLFSKRLCRLAKKDLHTINYNVGCILHNILLLQYSWLVPYNYNKFDIIFEKCLSIFLKTLPLY